MKNVKKLVYGYGINDADYEVSKPQTILGKVYRECPFYSRWQAMLCRCYSVKFQERQPTYVGCTVYEEWLTFSNFKVWMEKQHWEGKDLDKDLLLKNNKVYSPDTCVFVSTKVNRFLVATTQRGGYPIGVKLCRKSLYQFRAQCNNPFTGKGEHLGYFKTPEEGHKAWLKRKLELAQELAAQETDPRIAKALIDRYDVDVYVPVH